MGGFIFIAISAEAEIGFHLRLFPCVPQWKLTLGNAEWWQFSAQTNAVERGVELPSVVWVFWITDRI